MAFPSETRATRESANKFGRLFWLFFFFLGISYLLSASPSAVAVMGILSDHMHPLSLSLTLLGLRYEQQQLSTYFLLYVFVHLPTWQPGL